jgi:ribosome-binding protein aMBF1 (putative translation factor)
MKLDGPKLRRAREAKGWSQTKLAKACKPKSNVVTVCNAENSREIYPETARKICTALDIEIKEVMLPAEGDSNAA